MREFTPKEQDFIKKINSYKNNKTTEKLWFYNLLSEIIPGYYIKWNTPSQKYLEETTLYLKSCNKEFVKDKFYEFVDLLLLIEELEKYKLISIRHGDGVSFANNRIFDYNFFETKKDNNTNDKSIHKIVEKSTRKIVEEDNSFSSYTERIDIVDLIKRYHSAIIYPLPLLNDFSKNDFKDIELRRFESEQHYNRENQESTKKALKHSKLGIFISAFAVIVSAFSTIFNTCCSDNITTNDAKEIVSAIKDLKTTETDNSTPQLFDTLEIKVLTPHSHVVKEKANTSLPQQDTLTQIK